MSKSNTEKPKRAKRVPFKGYFQAAKLPMADALYHIQLAMFELDTLLTATIALRDTKVQTVSAYKDANGKTFEKAQKAALEADKLTARANTLRNAKIALYGDLARLWGKYSGEPEEGPVVAYWLCKDYSPETIAQKTKTSLEFVNGVLFKFRNFLMVIGKAHRSSKPYMEDYIVNLWAIEMGKTK